jgi:heptosyltransferase-2
LPPPRILLLRFSAIGDILLTTPLIRALRRRHPGAHLAAFTRAEFLPLLSDSPHLDQVHGLGPGEPLRSLARRVRAGRYTHLLDLHGSLRTRALRRLVSGRWGIFSHHRMARWLLVRTKRDRYPADALPVAERYFEAARELGAVPDGGPPEFGLHADSVAWARSWLAAHGLGRARRLVAVAPGAAHLTKRWPVESWRVLVGRLADEGRDIVVLGGPGDRGVAAAVADAGGARAVSAAGEATLQGTGALLAAATAAVAGDTGVMHMATAVGTPVAALFGPTVRQFGFFPYQARAEVLELPLPCRPCSYHGGPACPLGHHRCLRDITLADVAAAVARVGG